MTSSSASTSIRKPETSSSSGETRGGAGRGVLLGLLALVALALALRLWPVDHGLPRGYVPDNHVVRNALGMARDKDLVPEVGRYSSYPNLVPYMLLPVYAGQYVAGRISGDWSDAAEFGRHAMEYPGRVQLPARVLVAILGGLTTLVVFLAARCMGLTRGAWVAAWMVATSLLHIHFSVQERPWVPLVFFGALAVLFAEKYRQKPRTSWLLASGAAAGLSFACHQAGLPFIGIPVIAWLLAGGEGRRPAPLVACLAAFLVFSLALGHPYLLRYGLTPIETAVRDNDQTATGNVGGQQFIVGASWSSFRSLSTSIFGYDPVLCLLAILGLLPALKSFGTRAVTVFACLHGLVFLTYPNDHVRYLLPTALLLTFAAGAGVERWLKTRAAVLVLAPLLLLPLVQSLRLGWLLSRDDTRAIAEARLAELPEGAFVAIDHYGPAVDLDAASLETLASWRPLRTREEHRLLMLKEGLLPGGNAGVRAVFVEELFQGDARRGGGPGGDGYEVREALAALGENPREVLAAIGVTHLALVDRRPGDGIDPPLSHLMGAIVFEVDPSRGGSPAREALLPTEMDFPLLSLWSVDRPGPWLRLAELGR